MADEPLSPEISWKMDGEPVPDSTGHTMLLYSIKRKPYLFTGHAFNHEVVENMPEFPMRDDDILLCSYTKCGCHWLWEIASQLLSGEAKTHEMQKEQSMMELHERIHDLDNLPSPRILNNHTFFELQPKDMLKKKLKVLFVYRNPKDVSVSYFHHVQRLAPFYKYTGDFKAFLVRFAEGLLDNNSIFDYLRSWEDGIKANPDMNIFIMSYEDLKSDPLPILKGLSKFLGKDYDDEFLTAVSRSTSFDAMKSEKREMWKDEKGSIMYRKGKVGDWKDHFTVAQNEWFDHIIRVRMKDSTLFKFKYSI